MEAAQWVDIYNHTYFDRQLIAYPDGGCYFEQNGLMMAVFDIMQEEVTHYLVEQREKGGRR